MNRRSLIALIGAYAACARADRTDMPPPLNASEQSAFAPFADGIAGSPSCLLYEGLPNAVSDNQQYKRELATKPTIYLRGFDFYKKQLPLTAEDLATLRALSISAASYWGDRGPKMCGPFHPDFCLVWLGGNVVYDQLICFGCQEAWFFGGEADIHFDIRSSAAAQFLSTFTRYRGERPKPANPRPTVGPSP